MELILQKVCGRPAQLPIRLRRCGPADAAAFFALQNEVRAAMPHPEQFAIIGFVCLYAIEIILRTSSVHRGIRRRTAGGVLYPALLRPERAQLCGLPRGAPGRVGALGQCRQRGGPPGLARQRSAAEAAGSGAAPCPARHRGHRGHRQPGESIQPEQCPCLRFCHCRPP